MDNGHVRFFGLATLACVAVTLQIMGCALFHNWWYVYLSSTEYNRDAYKNTFI